MTNVGVAATAVAHSPSHHSHDNTKEAAMSDQREDIDGYFVPVDPMSDLDCEACQ